MNKRIVAVIVALAVIVIAAVAIVAAQNMNDSAEPIASSESSQSSENSSAEPAEASTAENDGGGAYVDYSPTAIADADGRVILFFHATWCPQCVAADGDITASGVPSGITIVKVDYDTNQDLRAQYGVTQQTTFVEVDSQGDKVQDNFVAYADPTLNAVLTALN